MSRKRLIIAISSFTALVLLAFQACTGWNSTTASDFVINAKQENNGSSYAGKIGHQRFVPGYTCNGKKSFFASLEVQNNLALLTTSGSQSCEFTQSIPIDEVELSSFSNNYLGYKEGIYTFYPSSDLAIEKEKFTEAWCKPMTGESFEVAVEWQQSGQIATLFYFDKDNVAGRKDFVNRRIDIDRVQYSSKEYSLEIQYNLMVSDSQKFPGQIVINRNGAKSVTQLQCRMGGQFDPAAPKFYYDDHFLTIQKDFELIPLVPAVSQPPISYKIDPELPEGLRFDEKTGVLSGSPKSVSIRNKYSVTAVFTFGEVTRVLSIAVAQVVSILPNSSSLIVGQPCTDNDRICSFSSAIERANRIQPVPLILNLEGINRLELPDSREIEINGDISINGTNTILDAMKASRHFRVNKSGHLALHKVVLINGLAAQGGSIFLDAGELHLKSVKLLNNTAQTDEGFLTTGQGGAIYQTTGFLSIIDSEFVGNSTPMSGSNLRGGAIHSRDPSSLSIFRTNFIRNSSVRGGAVYLETAIYTSEIVETRFTENSAFEGGAIFTTNFSNLKIDASLFENNTALVRGGAINAQTSNLTLIENSKFERNTADNGSGIYFYGFSSKLSSLAIANTEFKNNQLTPRIAQMYPNVTGSVLHYDATKIVLKNSLLKDHLRQNNCSTRLPELISFISIGVNVSDDKSCPF